MMLKRLFLSIIFLLFLSINACFAENSISKEADNLETPYLEVQAVARFGAIPINNNYLTSQSYVAPSNNDFKITLAPKSRLRLLLGTTSMVSEWRKSDPGFPLLLNGYDKSESLFIHGWFVEIDKAIGKWELDNGFFGRFMDAIIIQSKSEIRAGLRMNFLSASKNRTYLSEPSGATTLQESLRGDGYKFSLLFGEVAPLKFFDKLIFTFNLLADYYYIPLTGTLNGSNSNQEINGFSYGVESGLGLRF